MNYIVSTDPITLASDSPVIVVKAADVIYTKAMKLRYAVAFSLQIALASAGTPDMKIEIEEGNQPPTTEGAADLNFVVPDSMAALYSSLTDKLVHIKQFTPVCAQYMRLKITGNAGSGDTTITAKLTTQQPV